MSETFDAIVIGAGAAGLMCALTAGQRGAKVLLLDHLDKAGAKILISGGGRCNFTNLHCAPERFISANPHFHKSALDRYTPHDFIALVERHRIPYHEKTLGQLFCDGSARAVVGCCSTSAPPARSMCGSAIAVTDIARPDGFRVETDKGSFGAAALVLATGALSIPKMGATGFAYEVARRFGLRVTETLPGLVPLTATPEALGLTEMLSGISLDAVASCGAQSFRENILFTHRGLSGPAILQISSYWRPGGTIALDLLPAHDAEALLKERKRARPKAEPKTVLGEVFPARLAAALAASLPDDDHGEHSRPHAQRARRAAEALRRHADRLGRLRQGRGHGGRDRHARPVVPDHGGPQRPGPLRDRRSGRRHRLARRLQFPMGLGERLVRRAGHFRRILILRRSPGRRPE